METVFLFEKRSHLDGGKKQQVHLFDIRAGHTLEQSRRGRVVTGTPRRDSLRFGHGYSRHREGGRHLDWTAHSLTPQRHRDHCLWRCTYMYNHPSVCKRTQSAVFLCIPVKWLILTPASGSGGVSDVPALLAGFRQKKPGLVG